MIIVMRRNTEGGKAGRQTKADAARRADKEVHRLLARLSHPSSPKQGTVRALTHPRAREAGGTQKRLTTQPGAAGAEAERGSVTRSMFVCKLGGGRPDTCFAWRAAAAHRAALRKICANCERFRR